MGLKLRTKGGGVVDPAPSKITRPLYTAAGAVWPYSPNLADAFSYVDRFKNPYTNYKVIGKGTENPKIVLPRARFALGSEDRRCEGTDVPFVLHTPPRNEQQRMLCDELDAYYDTGKTGIIVNASTGFGKTYIGCSAMAKIQATTLVLITKSDLEDQWAESFEKFLGLDRTEIGLIKGDKHNISGKKVVIGYVQSVMKDDRYPSWVYKYFGFVIADEVHLMAADKFSNCMFLLPAVYRLGLSATVTRSDGRERVFNDHIGSKKIIYEMLPMKFDVVVINTGVAVPKTVKFKAGRTMALNNFLGQHQNRQRMISQKVKKSYEKGRNCVCFADTREHLDYAYDCLINEGIPMKDIGFYVGQTKATREVKDELKRQALKPVVLATYKMTSYGTDFPHWDTAFLMTPRSDVQQIVGRVVREKAGKKNPVVFDFVDPLPLLLGYFKNRMKWYKKKADRIISGG